MDKNIITCSRCRRDLEATTINFHKSRNGKFGLHSICKDCRKQQRMEYHYSEKGQRKYKENYKQNKYTYLVRAMRKRGYKDLTEQNLKDIVDSFTNSKGNQECAYCGREFTDDSMRHFDHYLPYSKNKVGDKLTNLVVTCKYCNRSKAHDEFKEWYRDQVFYDASREKKILSYVKADKIKPFYQMEGFHG